MEILSLTSSKLRLHSSPSDLSTVCEYSHAQKDAACTDFSLLPLPNSFMQINKSTNHSSCLNLFRLKKKDDNEIFDLIQKTKGENINVVGFCKVPKKQHQSLQYSVGLISGKIKTFDLSNKLIAEFPAPCIATSVIFIDYNTSDEILASVYESGIVNIYGFQTSVKLDTQSLDNQSTLARFHPAKRSHLAVASYSGGVSVVDIYAKKPIFRNYEAHTAPCSDVLMSEDLLFSSGYDTAIKIFDLRKKSFGLQIKGSYGWTTLAMSKCGAYFIGGNMKGEITTYDMRNLKKPLANVLVEKANQKIVRVAFLPSGESDSVSAIDISKAVRQSLIKLEEEIENELPAEETNDGFIEDIVGFQKGRISDFSSNTAYGSRVSTSSRRSSFTPQDAFTLKNIKNPFDSPVNDSHVNKGKRRSLNTSTRLSWAPQVLKEIREDMGGEKENNSNLINMHSPHALITAPRYSSTPSIAVSAVSPSKKCEDIIEIDDSFKSVENTEIKSNNVNRGDGDVTPAAEAAPANFDFRKEFDALAEKIRIEVQSMNMDENMRHIEMIYHSIEQRKQLQDRIHLIEESMALLMSEDYKINRILELQNENNELRRQLGDMARRMSH